MSEGSDPLAPLEAPLASAARQEFRLLARVRDLGKTQLRIIARLREAQTLGASEAALLGRIEPLMEDFDALPLPLRRERVARALALLREHRQGRLWEEPADTPSGEPSSAPPAAAREPSRREQELAENAQGSPAPSATSVEGSLDALAGEVTYVKGVGPRMAQVLGRLDIKTIEDLLWHLPHRYEDRRHLKPIAQAQPGEFVVIRGTIETMGRAGRRVFEALVSDESGRVRLKWFRFNEKRLREQLSGYDEVFLSGEVKAYRGQLEMHHPDIDPAGEDSAALPDPIVPVYGLTEGLHPKRLRAIVGHALARVGPRLADGLDPLAAELAGEPLPALAASLCELHAPSAENDVGRLNAHATLYHRRLRLHEAFFLQLGLLRRGREHRRAATQTFDPKPPILAKFVGGLPFDLTGAQRRVIAEIAADLSEPHPMNRLLQGDVGSGKTLVAAAASLIAIAGGAQAALMAPTEILAEQHYRNLSALLAPLGVEVALLTGSQKLSTGSLQAGRVAQLVERGQIGLVVGTHALIQETVRFARLALAITDEQHRFGVAQRAELRGKGENPHALVMTATPIPRTLTLTLYGDLEVSLLDEMPPGRTPVETRVFAQKARREVWRRVGGELAAGRQAYVVYPLVSESEKLDLRNALDGAAELQNEVFPDYRVGVVHGQMKSEEKEAVLGRFRRGEIDLLVSTTVIEVGIDVPAATVMVVEHAERFGLSQLHQLRGRVGRGRQHSYCYLIAAAGIGACARARLDVLEGLSDGFEVAEEDLRLRGPGEFLGTRQSGLPDFKALDLLRDQRLLARAREGARDLLNEDPKLAAPAHRALARAFAHYWQSRGRFLGVG